MATFPIVLPDYQKSFMLTLEEGELEALGHLANRNLLTKMIDGGLRRTELGGIPEFDDLLLTDIFVRTAIENGLVHQEMADLLVRYIDVESCLEDLLDLVARQEPQRRQDWEADVEEVLSDQSVDTLEDVMRELGRYEGLINGKGSYGAPSRVLAKLARLDRKVGPQVAAKRLGAARSLAWQKKQSLAVE